MAKGAPGSFDVDERLAVLPAKGDDLERVKARVDFEVFRSAGSRGPARRPLHVRATCFRSCAYVQSLDPRAMHSVLTLRSTESSFAVHRLFAFTMSLAAAGRGLPRSSVEDLGERGPCKNTNAGGAAAGRQSASFSSRR